MVFKSIELKNFRNYNNLSLDFNPSLNLILGKNAQGKTNIIESLFIMGLGKSFRTNKDYEMIMFGEDYCKVKALILDEDKEIEIEITFSREGKLIKVDGVKLSKSMDLLENVYIVVFSPDDLRIIKDGPESRRRFIDRELCQIKPLYYSDLGSYKRIIKQRNVLLKNKNNDKELYNVFNESLAEYGLRIVKERYLFIDKLSEISNNIHSSISGNTENLKISYDTDISLNFKKEDYIKKLEESFEKDLIKGFTSFGPHKDDLCLEINDIDIRSFGSQGQQRTAALSLKLAEIDLIKQETNKNAVLLLDDVMSELDVNRQKFLIDAMKNIQVFITATDLDPTLKNLLPEGKTFFVDNARVEIYNN